MSTDSWPVVEGIIAESNTVAFVTLIALGYARHFADSADNIKVNQVFWASDRLLRSTRFTLNLMFGKEL